MAGQSCCAFPCVGQPWADEQKFVCEPTISWKATLALRRVFGISAMVQWLPLSIRAWQMNVVLFALLQAFHIILQVCRFPVVRCHVVIPLVCGPTDHQVAVLVFRPFCFDVVLFLLPVQGLVVDSAPDMC